MADSAQNAVVEQILKFDNFFDEQDELGHILSKSSLASQTFRLAGNKLYTKKNHSGDDHKQTLLLYTRSISFAPNDSEDLAKGYGNRSALLMELHRYEECLTDINRALQISKCNTLRAKLKSRKLNCLKFCSKKSTGTFSEKLPNIQPSSKILSASEAVDIEYNDTFGRHLVATRDMKPGEIIVVEKGYACFPNRYQIHIICSHCMAFAWNGIPCDFCVFVIFCSERCKQAAWKEYHNIECSIIPFLFFDKDSHITNTIVAIRVFITAIKNEGFDSVINIAKLANEKKIKNFETLLWNGMLVSNMFCSCYNLITHTEDNIRSSLDENLYESMIVNLLLRHTSIIPVDMKSNNGSKTTDELLILLVNIFADLRNLLDVNGFAYQGNFCVCPDIYNCKNLCDSNRGSIIVPTCSLVNHSCCPNINRMFIPDRRIVMYTVAPVKKGQQFCDSYGPTFTMARKERQNYLKKYFYFTCRCTACEENWPSQLDVELFRNPVEDTAIMSKVMREFEKYFPDHKTFSIKTISKCIQEHKFDKSTLEKVIKFSELVYKYFSYRQAFYRSLEFALYIDRSFFQFYGEKCEVPKACVF